MPRIIYILYIYIYICIIISSPCAITAFLSQTVIATDVYCDVTHAHTPNTDVVIGFDQTLYTAYENDGVTYVTASVQQGTLRQSVYALHRYQTLQNGLVTSMLRLFVFLQFYYNHSA